MKSQKQFFLISFIPAIAYWYLEEHYNLKIALMGGMILALAEISLEKILTKHVHTISKFNFFLIFVLGTIAFIGSEGIWFKLQPFFTGILMGGYLLFKLSRGESLMLDSLKAMNGKIPNEVEFKILEKHLSFFLIIYGFFMAYIAIYQTTSTWTFYKTIGFYIASILFFIFQFIRVKLKNRRKL